MTVPGIEVGVRTRLFAWSTVPALVAWPAVLLPPRYGAMFLAAGR